MEARSDESKSYTKEKQGEFFADSQMQSIKKPRHFFRQDIALGKKFTINIAYENLVLLFIIIIMSMVVFFSLGVEKGKRVASRYSKVGGTERVHRLVKKEEAVEKKINEEVTSKVDIGVELEIPKISKGGETTEKKESTGSIKPYTIQVIAFKNEESAKKEVERLKDEGYEVFIIPSKDWLQVCVGRYTNREESKKDFDVLRNRYPTCYFRRIE